MLRAVLIERRLMNTRGILEGYLYTVSLRSENQVIRAFRIHNSRHMQNATDRSAQLVIVKAKYELFIHRLKTL